MYTVNIVATTVNDVALYLSSLYSARLQYLTPKPFTVTMISIDIGITWFLIPTGSQEALSLSAQAAKLPGLQLTALQVPPKLP